MLNKFPPIKSVCLKYNTPFPSGQVKRLFNYSKMISTPNRRSLVD